MATPALPSTPKKFLQTGVGLALSLGVLFLTVWVVSEAWKKGQAKKSFTGNNPVGNRERI